MFVRFFRPLVFSDQSLSFLPYLGKGSGTIEKCSHIVDNYFHLGGEKSVIVKGVSSNSFLYVTRIFPISNFEKILKILSYILILPVILTLVIKIVLRIILFFKYHGLIIGVKEEELKKLLLPNTENLSLPAASPEALKNIHALHTLVRSGKTYNELIQQGFSFTKTTRNLHQIPSPNRDIGFSYDKLFPGFYFHSFVSTPNALGSERALNYHQEKQREMIFKLKNTQPYSFVFRSQYFPLIQTENTSLPFGLATLVLWKISPIQN
ncbi:DUF648 domain-containing protein [Candidatus Chlamydia corallus]|uniref:DUF648 domain-containing protein n=1 Tax=Candidatus Chlamydia corallus TaxID=2038470 RepID=UPI000C2FDDF1|nr:DUF648 domain-containing protein [Candidatus Chlamydia corallus]